jgi:transcriptional regulator with XRE-family HTH domain
MLPAYRMRRGWSQEDLVRRSGLSVRAIRDLERGHVRRPRPASISLLADALELTEAQRRDLADAVGEAQGLSMPPGAASPAQLPAAVAAFTGRLDELAALDAVLLGQGQEFPQRAVIAAITGSAGMGKTALAVQWAHRVCGEFPDGQLFIDLDGYSRAEALRPIEALAYFLQALGVPGEKVPTRTAQAAGL